MTINEIQDEIIAEFEGLTDWMDRYAYIIELGNSLPPFPENEKTPANLIEGCLHSRRNTGIIPNIASASNMSLTPDIIWLIPTS